jgi:hypothetical protein
MANACHENKVASSIEFVARQITAASTRNDQFSQSTVNRPSDATRNSSNRRRSSNAAWLRNTRGMKSVDSRWRKISRLGFQPFAVAGQI